MSIIKLVPGQRIAFGVAATEIVEGNYGPQIKFSGATPDDDKAVLFLNVEPATRQLERIGLTVDSVVGQRIEVERVEKNGTKYTNISKAGGVDFAKLVSKPAPAATQKQPLSAGGPLPWEQEETGAPPKSVPSALDSQFSLYDVCLDHALAAATKRFGKDVTDTAVAAMAATLYIQAQRAGV